MPKREAADTIFDLLAKFADYGFNKSHAAAYALIAYQTAYLKANHPGRVPRRIDDATRRRTPTSSPNSATRRGVWASRSWLPSINRSGVDFDVEAGQPGAIIYALSAIKGAGEGQIAAIVAARGGTPFASLADFAMRVGSREVNKKVLESLAAAGAFDELEPDRARVFAGIETILATASRAGDDRLLGQSALFGAVHEQSAFRLPAADTWPAAERLRREFDAVGFFLSGHPLDDYAAILHRLRVRRWSDFVKAVKDGESSARLAVTVLDRFERRTKSGNKIGIVTLSDPTGQFEAIMFQETLNEHRDLFEKGSAVLITVHASAEGDEVRVRILVAEALDAAAHRLSKGLRIHVRNAASLPAIAKELDKRGDAEVSFVVVPVPGRAPSSRSS